MTTLREVWCLLLSPDKTPIGRPLPVEVSSNATAAQLKVKIKEKKPKRLLDVDPDELALWKSKEPATFAWTDPKALVDQIRQLFSKNEGEILGEDTKVLELSFGVRDLVFAQLPDDATWQRHALSWQALDKLVTFKASSRHDFGSFSYAILSNEITESTEPPDHISELLTTLSRERFLAKECSETFKPHLGEDISRYFTDHSGSNVGKVSDHERAVYTSLFASSLVGPQAEGAYLAFSEGFGYHFLIETVTKISSLLGNMASYSFRKSWDFSLIAEVLERTEVTYYSYTPKSDFSFHLSRTPIIILEICSDAKESDRSRLMIQAGCLIRLWNHILGKRNIVVMAIYVAKNLILSRYLFFQREDSTSSQVEYLVDEFDLRKHEPSFRFLFHLYNFVDFMEKAGKELTPKSDGKKISQHITGGFPSFTNTETITKRKKDSERDGSPQNKRSRPDDTPINQSKVKKALSENGYQILEEEEVEGWTRIDPLKPSLCRAKSRNGDVVVVKLLKKNSVELDVLRSLNHNKSEASHVVELLDSLHLDIGTVIILPLASPLRCTDSSSAHCLIYQLIEAVSFIHGHGVAHLDLKPSNILVSHAHGLPYLVVIDFSVSVFASSPDFQIEGFVGTPHWTAPEIGTFDGPPQTYSPIRADLWSCGNMMKYIADQASIRDPQLLQLAEELLSSDPLKRPLLGKESNTFHTPQPKRKCFTPDHFQGTVQKRHCAFHCENRHWEQGVSLYG